MNLPSIPNYDLIELLGESLNASVYKAASKQNPKDLYAIKLLKHHIKNTIHQRHLKQKVERLKIIHESRLILPESIEFYDDNQYILRQYFSGENLEQYLIKNNGPLPLNIFFTIANELTLAISAIHEAGIIHGGIKPHNILINAKSNEVKIIDFMSPVPIQEISNFIYDKDFVESTIAFTSPEQTGRINHRIEFSTDIYSLGIIFYQMLTGKLPFSSTDPLELIHSHLAEEALPIHHSNFNVPEIISAIVAKMCLKEPEKRYQSCMGLYEDIHRCKLDYQTNRIINPFTLGLQDQTRRVVFISKMMGRSVESNIILDEYDKVTSGRGFHSIFIAGLPGIGKTRLIQELQKPLVKNNGYFTSGKFDQYQKNIPYSSLIQAFRNHIRTLLTESNQRVNKHKEKILLALGSQGKVITDVIPELTLLIGSQPEVPTLPPVEARNRFNNLLGLFLESLTSDANSLILFIDDLQWCDTATFDFLQYLFANGDDFNNLFFIGAFRNNEIYANHPLELLLNKINEQKRKPKELQIGALPEQACHEMVAYILNLPLSQTKQLTHFLAELSEGNPLFVSESLSWLHNESLLIFNEQGQWVWDMEKITRSNMPTTVVEMFGSKVRQLQSETLDIIKVCACMGNRFAAEDIALINDIDLIYLFELLKPVLTLGLLVENKTEFQFVHDRVQEAVLSILTVELKKEIHWKIGCHLLDGETVHSDLEKNEKLFTIAAHLNLGIPNTIRPDSILLLAKVNLHAGEKALNSLATQAANEYFRKGLELLSDDTWTTHYQLMFRLHQKLAKTELMCGCYEQSERLLNELLTRSIDDLDRAEALAEQTTSLSSVGNFIQAIETANRGLSYFEKQISDDDEVANEIMERLLRTIETKHGDIWKSILNMPFTEQRKSKIELIFYSELIPDLYMSGMVPQLYLSAAQSTLHCLQGGMDESVIYSFSIMGLNYGTRGQYEIAFHYEDLAHELCARYPDTFGATRGINGIVWCNMHSRSHPQDIVDYCYKGIQSGKNCGDLYNAGLSYGPLMWNLQVQGSHFNLIELIAKECLDFSLKNHLQFSIGLAEAVQFGWIEPMKGKVADSSSMKDKLIFWKQNNYVASAGSYYTLLGMSHYYFGRYQEADDCLIKVECFLSGMTDNVLKRQWYVFKILTALRVSSISSESNQQLEERLSPMFNQLKVWSDLGPLLKPYTALCQAEWSRYFSDSSATRLLYLDAIEQARRLNYLFLDGFINELFARFLDDNECVSCDQYFNTALNKYTECGSKGKREQLRDKLFEKENNIDEPVFVEHVDEPALGPSLPDLDVDYLIKWSIALSAKIDQHELLSTISSVLLECSGAQHGYLLQQSNDEWFITSASHVVEDVSLPIAPFALSSASDICQGIVHFVSRTREKVVLNDASKSDEFNSLPEIKHYALRSILCVPVLHQSELIAILYLDNRLSPGIFNTITVRMIELLSMQMAISIENTLLLSEQKEQQNLIQRSQKMEALGKLTGGIAHDYNNMLGVVLGYAGLLKSALKDDKKLSKFANEIQHAGERSANLTKKLLAFSRETASQTKPVNINDLFKDMQNMLEKILTARIELIINYEDEVWPILIDSSDMEDALLNICINAMHAMNSSGKLIISISNRLLKEADALRLQRKPGYYVSISITDTGCGMNESTKEKIFDPFYSTKGEKGTGLGLSQVYGFLERSCGYIEVQSELDSGTQFILNFPRYFGADNEDSSEDNTISEQSRGDETILIVDDELSLVSLTSEILTLNGYKVLSANSAKEALEILDTKSVDLMLSDIIMPEMDGYELATIVQDKYPTVKIQLTSGFSKNNKPGLIQNNFTSTILQKPYNANSLLITIRKLLD